MSSKTPSKEGLQFLKNSLSITTSQMEIKNIVGNYKIEKSIGEGTFGKVKIGKHLPTGEKVAVKILEKDKIKDKKALERVTRELAFLRKLEHPNIVRLYEIVENSNFIYLFMEYPRHGELFEHIVKKRRLNEVEASLFFTQIINGIEYMHKFCIAHRDLKPENLILDENRLLKIIDFGLSNNYTDTLVTPCGSPCYAAPEMLQGKKYHGLSIDIWSTGIVLYAMIFGFLPFEDENNNVLYKKILECKPEFPFKINTICLDMIKKILTPDPEKRISLEDIKKHAFYVMGQKVIKKEAVYPHKNENIKCAVYDKMGAMGIKESEIQRDLKSREFNNITATYYLLYKKFETQMKLSEPNEEEIPYLSTEPTVNNYKILEETKTRLFQTNAKKPATHKVYNTALVESKNPYFMASRQGKRKIDFDNTNDKKILNTEINTPNNKLKMKLLEFNLKESKNNINNYLLGLVDKTRNFKIKEKYIKPKDLKFKEMDLTSKETITHSITKDYRSNPFNSHIDKLMFKPEKTKIQFHKADILTSLSTRDSYNYQYKSEINQPKTTKNETSEVKLNFKPNGKAESQNMSSKLFLDQAKNSFSVSSSVEKYSSYKGFKEMSKKLFVGGKNQSNNNSENKSSINQNPKNFNVSSKQFYKKYI